MVLLIIAVPSRENEFRKLSLEQEKKQIKINEKINTLIGIFNKTIAIKRFIAMVLLKIPINVFIFSFILICFFSCSRESFLNSFSLLGTAIINKTIAIKQ